MKRRPSIFRQSVRRAGNCTTCMSTGQVSFNSPLYFKFMTCPACNGTGRGH